MFLSEKKWSNTYNILNLEVRLRFHQQITIMHNSTWWTLHLPNNHMIYWTLLVVHLEDALVHLKIPNFAVPIIRLNFIFFFFKLIPPLPVDWYAHFYILCFVFWRGGVGGLSPLRSGTPLTFFTQAVSSWKNALNVWYVCGYLCMYYSILIYLFSTSCLL